MCKRSHALCDIKSLMHTVSPLLHIAVFNSQLASEDHGASRGSRVSGKSVRQAGIRVDSWSRTRGKRLLSEIVARGGFATGVFPPRKNCSQPNLRGRRANHSA